MMLSLKTIIKENSARFVCYRDGELWYRIETDDTDQPVFDFPIPIKDTGTGIFDCQMKAITLMRWIRRQFEKISSGEWGA